MHAPKTRSGSRGTVGVLAVAEGDPARSRRGRTAAPLDTYCVPRPDVEDAVNQLRRRDPEQHCPSRLAWDGLIRVLHEHGLRREAGPLICGGDAPRASRRVRVWPRLGCEIRVE